jgi:hydrogenase assembly chaperone HypC/HupF
MCLMAPARVIAVDGSWADVEVEGLRRRASTLAVPDIRAGDWALLAAGTLVRLLDPADAREIADANRAARDAADPPGLREET